MDRPGTDTTEQEIAAPDAVLAGLETGPQPVEIQLSPETAATLASLEYQYVSAMTARDQFQAGLCAGLGIDLKRVMSLDVAHGRLILTPEPE